MAVKVWLPLNGDTTTNNGLSAVSASIVDDSHTASYAAGILGHSGLVLGTDKFTLTLPAMSKFSVSFWVKESNSAEAGDVLLTIGTFAVTKTATGYEVDGLASGDLFTLESGWNHVVITADGTNVIAYVNGAEAETLSQVGGSIAANTVVYIGGDATGNEWPGVISDLKISDHVMSLFEAYTEAHGLVVNYGFNGVTSLGSGVTLPTGTVAADWGFGTKECDLSGNEYDATFGTIKPISSNDSAIYSASFNFTGADAVTSPTIVTTEFATSYTVSVWAKGSGTIAAFSNGTADLTGASDTSDWHNIVVTSSGKKYVDGEEVGTLSGLIGTGNCTITIGGGFTGLLSDFRVYATELSDDEIEALYKRKAAVDKSGKLIASEFVSLEATDGTAFGKNGVVSAVNLVNFNGSYDSENDEITGMTNVAGFSVVKTTETVNAVDVIEY